METLRALLIQRAARLQEWPAVTAPDWGTLRYPAFRNRVEGVALGLMAAAPDVGTRLRSRTGGPWDWACEVACACCGLVWDPDGEPVPTDVLGGSRFNDEAGRQAYHDRDHDLDPGLPFQDGLTHSELLTRLRRLNGRLGWDHATELELPSAEAGTAPGRAALWSALYAGAHVRWQTGKVRGWDPEPFRALLS